MLEELYNCTKDELETLVEILSLLTIVKNSVSSAKNEKNVAIVTDSLNTLSVGINALDECIDRLTELNEECVHAELIGGVC